MEGEEDVVDEEVVEASGMAKVSPSAWVSIVGDEAAGIVSVLSLSPGRAADDGD